MGALMSSRSYGDTAAPYESQFLLFIHDHCEVGNYHCPLNEFVSAVATYLYTQNQTLGFDDEDMETTVCVIKCLIHTANSHGHAIKFGGIVSRKHTAYSSRGSHTDITGKNTSVILASDTPSACAANIAPPNAAESATAMLSTRA